MTGALMVEQAGASVALVADAGVDWSGVSMTEDSWRDAGGALARQRARLAGMGSRLMWEVGDWLVRGEDEVLRHMSRIHVRRVAADITGYSRHTLTMAASVARKVRPATRLPELTWWHHLVVARLDRAEQARWLERAAGEQWPARALRRELGREMPARGRQRRALGGLVGQLVRYGRADITPAEMVELRAWYVREMAAE
jgi:hypothetical protein